MGLLSKLFGKGTQKSNAPTEQQEVSPDVSPVESPLLVDNIWDMDDEDDAPQPAAGRRRRNVTRVIGFNHSAAVEDDPFDSDPNTSTAEQVLFPVGWLLVVEGEGRGHCFPIKSGMSQIGRETDNTVSLDFGDNTVSRKNHAAVVYDDQDRSFILGHGGKSNIVRLNGKPVISNEELSDGDQIRIGETTLQLKVLCDDNFDWAHDESGDEEHDHVAIA